MIQMIKTKMMSNKVVLAYSGGLDTSYCVKYLTIDKGLEVHTVAVDTGGFSKEDYQFLEERSLELGAKSHRTINALEKYYDECIKYLIFGNVLKNNTYPLSVSAERFFQAIAVAEYANEIDAQYIAHGSTGAGNDQVRFDLAFDILAPGKGIITPIREMSLSRQEEVEYLKQHGVELSWEKAQYSINKGLWGTSVGGAETLTSHQALPSEAYPNQLKNETPQQITIGFEKGEPISLNGESMTPTKVIQALNDLGADYAIGRDIHVGDTIIGIKGRVGFEAPAALILVKAHHLLEKHTQTKDQQQLKAFLADTYGNKLHEAEFLDPVMRDIEQFMQSTQHRVTGEVYVNIAPYNFQVVGVESQYDMMKSKAGQYGEANKAWSSDDAIGFIKIYGMSQKIYHSIEE